MREVQNAEGRELCTTKIGYQSSQTQASKYPKAAALRRVEAQFPIHERVSLPYLTLPPHFPTNVDSVQDSRPLTLRMAESLILPHDLSAIRSNECAEPCHPDTIDGLGHSVVPHSEPIGSSERLGRTSSENPFGSNEPGALLEKSSSEQSRLHGEVDELWSDLESGTRYSSYADNLKAYIAKHEGRDMLLGRLSGDPHSNQRKPPFTILDLSKDENSRLRVVPRFEDSIDSATRVIASLQQPPVNVTVQIVLWNSRDSLNKGTMNALGSALKLNPRFWGALWSKRRPQFEPRHARIGGFVATVVRHYKPDELEAVSVVLIACHGWELLLERAVDEEIGDVYPLKDPILDPTIDLIPPFYHGGTLRLSSPITHQERHGPTTYLRVLKLCLDKEEEQADEFTKLILKPLIPLLYLSVFFIRNCCENLRLKYRNLLWNAAKMDEDVDALHDDRHRLRALMEESEDDLSYLRRYVCSQISAERISDKSWRKAEADLIQIHQEAGRLESQVRDYMQLQVGELALQESKKSIELSNQQIEEGKRVKICKLHDQAYNDFKSIDRIAVTVLAFVYVPLNLATSIFGMNLSELNGSGKNIWVFLCTATVALLTTGVSWFVLEEVNNYLRWRRGIHNVKQRFALGQRIGMFVWLQQHGHTGWMWESGAWWRLLINSGSRAWSPMEVRGLSACDIVSKYGLHASHTAFNPFERRNKYKWRDIKY